MVVTHTHKMPDAESLCREWEGEAQYVTQTT